MRPESLVKMANQIAASVPDQEAAVEQTAAHLRAFWSPSMIDALADHAIAHPDHLTPNAAAALSLLRPGVLNG